MGNWGIEGLRAGIMEQRNDGIMRKSVIFSKPVRRIRKKGHMQGARAAEGRGVLLYVETLRGEAQHSIWPFLRIRQPLTRLYLFLMADTVPFVANVAHIGNISCPGLLSPGDQHVSHGRRPYEKKNDSPRHLLLLQAPPFVAPLQATPLFTSSTT